MVHEVTKLNCLSNSAVFHAVGISFNLILNFSIHNIVWWAMALTWKYNPASSS